VSTCCKGASFKFAAHFGNFSSTVQGLKHFQSALLIFGTPGINCVLIYGIGLPISSSSLTFLGLPLTLLCLGISTFCLRIGA
jgi:hypothetical protein